MSLHFYEFFFCICQPLFHVFRFITFALLPSKINQSIKRNEAVTSIPCVLFLGVLFGGKKTNSFISFGVRSTFSVSSTLPSTSSSLSFALCSSCLMLESWALSSFLNSRISLRILRRLASMLSSSCRCKSRSCYGCDSSPGLLLSNPCLIHF